jgi:hypothetical protein
VEKTFVITGTSPGSPSTAVVGSPALFGSFFEDVEAIDVLAVIQGATGGTLDLYLQTSPDGGTTWIDYVHFTQLAAAAAATTKRFGTTRHVQPALTAVGTGNSPALASTILRVGSR